MIARSIEKDEMTDSKDSKNPSNSTKSPTTKHWYSVPEPVRRVFDLFPLTTYPNNVLPQRARRKSDKHTLYIFANTFDDSRSGFSCNPACLKWQAYLRFNDIDFSVKRSNNHASPSGSLPFLLPASSTNDLHPTPLTTGKIPRWVSQQAMQEEDTLTMQHEAYMTLIDQNLRNAWLFHLYLVKENFDTVAYPLYVATTSSNQFVQVTIAQQLREAAETELLKSRNIIDEEEVYQAARKAFRALSTLLGSQEFFSQHDRPGLFDASVFAYTYLLLDMHLPWKNAFLSDLLRTFPKLVEHRSRLLKLYLRS